MLQIVQRNFLAKPCFASSSYFPLYGSLHSSSSDSATFKAFQSKVFDITISLNRLESDILISGAQRNSAALINLCDLSGKKKTKRRRKNGGPNAAPLSSYNRKSVRSKSVLRENRIVIADALKLKERSISTADIAGQRANLGADDECKQWEKQNDLKEWSAFQGSDQALEENSLNSSQLSELQDELLRRNLVLEEVRGKLDVIQTQTDLDWLSVIKSKFTPRLRGLVLLNILTLLYGSNISVVKEASAVMDPATFTLGRFAIASLAFSPFLSTALKDGRIRSAGVELGIWTSLGYLTQALGLLSTEAGRASFISTFTVIEVPIIAGLFGAKIPNITWLAAAAAVCGVGLLENAGGKSSIVGDGWTFISALMFGVHMIRSEHHSKQLDAKAAVPLIGLQLLVTAICSAIWSSAKQLQSGDMGMLGQLAMGDWPHITAELAGFPWLAMIYTGLASTAFCLWVEVVSLRDVSATEAAMVYTLEPLWGAAFAWTLLGERWGARGWTGAVLILGASMIMQLFGRSSTEEPAELLASPSKNPSAAAASALAAATLVSAIAIREAETPSSEETLQNALLLADALDLNSLVSLLKIFAVTNAKDSTLDQAMSENSDADPSSR